MSRIAGQEIALLCLTIGLFAQSAQAQHQGDVWVAVNTNGQLAISPVGFIPQDNYSPLLPSGGLLQGWTNDDPGFDHLASDQPEHGLSVLQSGAEVWLEVVTLDSAFRAIDDAFQLLDAPGDDTLLGGAALHEHITWHINSADGAFDPEQCVWHATFVVRDDGSTGYATSDPLTYSFTNVPVRALGVPADGDFDGDFDVDLDDHRAFVTCLFGPAALPQPDDPAVTTCEVECLNAFDFDDDRDVDLHDFAAFQTAFGN